MSHFINSHKHLAIILIFFLYQNGDANNNKNEEPNTSEILNQSRNLRVIKNIEKTLKKQPQTELAKTLGKNSKDIPSPPRDIISFEVSDAIAPSVEYEKLYKSRHLRHSTRVKRSVQKTNKSQSQKRNSTSFISTTEHYSFVTLPKTSVPFLTLPPPPAVFKFELSDAKIPDPSQIPQRAKIILSNGNSTKSSKSNIFKRDSSKISMDRIPNESRKIKIIHPLSVSGKKKRTAKYQTYEELPFSTQKIIDKAIADARSSNKLNNGEYLQFFYGDKIIISPSYPTKAEHPKPIRPPANQNTLKSNEYESYWNPVAKQKFKLAHDNFVLNPKLLGTKQSYFVADSILKPKDQLTPQMIINVQPVLNGYKEEIVKTNINNGPEQNLIPNHSYLVGQSTSFQQLGLNEKDTTKNQDSKKAVGPILFHPELSQPKLEEAFSYVNVEVPRTAYLRPVDLKYNHLTSYQQYQHNYEPNHMKLPQPQFPINYIKKLPPPTSYQELINYNSGNHHEEKEDYEFG